MTAKKTLSLIINNIYRIKIHLIGQIAADKVLDLVNTGIADVLDLLSLDHKSV